MNKSTLFIVFLVVIGLTACSLLEALPSDKPTDTPAIPLTSTRAPASTPTPRIILAINTPTNTPTSTPELPPVEPLPAQGPHLHYPVITDGLYEIVIRGMEGIGEKSVFLPEGASVMNLEFAVSPTGDLLAYHLGTAEEQPYDFRLCLLDLENGETSCIAKLLLDEYPDNLPDILDPFPELEIPEEHLEISLRSGIDSYSWSPDGRHLAFAGQLDGPSTDLYVYNTETQKVKRLSSEPRNIEEFSIIWSPDNETILFRTQLELGMGDELSDSYIAELDGTIFPVDLPWNFAMHAWASKDIVTYYQFNNGPGTYAITNKNLRNGDESLIFGGAFTDFLYDGEYGRLVVSLIYPEFGGPTGNEKDITAGTYFYHSDTGEFVLLENMDTDPEFSLSTPILYYLELWGSPQYRYVAETEIGGAGSYAITADGEIHLIDRFKYSPSPSPDGEWLILLSGPRDKIYLFDGQAQQVRELQFPNDTQDVVSLIQWRRDSKGLFFTVRRIFGEQEYYDLYYTDIPDGTPLFVDHSLFVPPYGSRDVLIWR